MSLFNFGINKTKYKCARCKKNISNGEFKWIGNHRFCFDCTNTKSELTLNNLPKAKPVVKISERPTVEKCRRCNKDLDPAQCKTIGKYCFCNECAQLPNGVALTENGNRFYFHYPVTDLHAEYEYWSNAVSSTHTRSKSNNPLPKRSDVTEIVECILICTTEDPQYATNYDFDWDVALWVFANKERTVWHFELQESFLSMWDAMPVYCGGAITASEAKEYFHRIGNHNYDNILF